MRATLEYWAAFPDEIDAWIEHADVETAEAQERWLREQALLGR